MILPQRAASFYFFFLFILSENLIRTLTINKFEIRDLEDHTQFFQQEAQPWSFSNQNNTNITQCAGTWLLGGYGTLGSGATFERSYSSLPSHDMVYFSISFWVLDIQDVKDLFTISINNVTLDTWSSATMMTITSGDSCGINVKDFTSIVVKGKVLHSSNSLTLTIKSLIDPAGTPPSFGFRDVNLLFTNMTSSQTTSSCAFSSTTIGTSCLCPNQQYNTLGVTSCVDCDSSCESCLAGTNRQCTSCSAGYSYNGQACSPCHPSCKQCSGTSESGCLRCYSNNFLYWNGTCQTSCNSPLVSRPEGDSKYCNLPCQKTEYFNTLESICQTSCLSPFISSSQGDLKLCSSPCLSTEFYDEQLQTCVANCDSPLYVQLMGLLKICKHPSANSTTNTTNTTSGTSGASGTTSGGSGTSGTTNNSTSSVTPASSRDSSILKDLDKVMVIMEKFSGKIVFILAITASFLRPSDPTPLIVLAFFDFLKYTQYIAVSYPQTVLDSFESRRVGVFSISSFLGIGVPSSLEEKVLKQSLPAAFEGKNIHSNFLINEWEGLIIFLFFVLLALIVWPVGKMLKESKKQVLQFVGQRLESVTRWNVFLLFIFAEYGDLTLFISLELRTLSLSSFETSLSFIICIFMMFFGSFFIWKIFQISKEAVVSRRTIHPSALELKISTNRAELFKKWQAFQILWRGFKNHLLTTQAYLFILALRIIFCYELVSWLHEYPIPQTVLLTTLNLAMLVYTLIKRPISHTYVVVECIIYEVIILVANLCVLVFAISDRDFLSGENVRNHIGAAVIILTLIVQGLSIIFIFFALVMSIRYILQKRKSLTIPHINMQGVQLQFEQDSRKPIQSPSNASSCKSTARFLSTGAPSQQSNQRSNTNGETQKNINSLEIVKDEKAEAKSAKLRQNSVFNKLTRILLDSQESTTNLKSEQATTTPDCAEKPRLSIAPFPMGADSSPIGEADSPSQIQLLGKNSLLLNPEISAHQRRISLLRKLATKRRESLHENTEETISYSDFETAKSEIIEPIKNSNIYRQSIFSKGNPMTMKEDEIKQDKDGEKSYMSDVKIERLDVNSSKLLLPRNNRVGLKVKSESKNINQSESITSEEVSSPGTNKNKENSNGEESSGTEENGESKIDVKNVSQEEAPKNQNRNVNKEKLPADTKVDLRRILYS